MSVALLGTTPPKHDLALLETVDRHIHETLTRFAREPLSGMARYHLGTGGRRYRARLTLTAASALGVAPLAAVPFAAACELLHNATLVHDDLQDGDTVRRGRPTAWTRFGANQAINAGDLLLMLPPLALEDSTYTPTLRWHLASALSRRAALTACGQSAEMQINAAGDHRWSAWWEAAEGKTGHLFALPVEGAALIAGLDPDAARDLADAVLPLGVLFQVQDDVLDLFGDKGRGQAGNDLREGKVSALTAAHIACRPDDRAWLTALLTSPREAVTEADVADAAARFMDSGAMELVRTRAWRAFLGVRNNPALQEHPHLRRELLTAMRTVLAPLVSREQAGELAKEIL